MPVKVDISSPLHLRGYWLGSTLLQSVRPDIALIGRRTQSYLLTRRVNVDTAGRIFKHAVSYIPCVVHGLR